MKKKYDDFRKAIEKETQALNFPDINEVISEFYDEIKKLVAEGIISWGPDYLLGGDALEFRVLDIFKNMGLLVEEGPPGLHDAVVRPPDGLEPTKPIVVEIKSSKNSSPSLDDLRELDDWVFELSGEESIRIGVTQTL